MARINHLVCLFTLLLSPFYSLAQSDFASAPSFDDLRHVASVYCVANDFASPAQLQAAIDFVCKNGVNCAVIQPGGPCFQPNTLNFHASAVLNIYFKSHGAQGVYCNAQGPLTGVGQLVFNDPSQGTCKFY